jgi:hypothetical protein
MTHKHFKQARSIDTVYDFDTQVKPYLDEDSQVVKGNDCIYRAMTVQDAYPDAPLNLCFGTPYYRGTSPIREGGHQVGQYFRGYTWHAWLEDEDAVYDSPDCLREHLGLNIPFNTVCVVSGCPTFPKIECPNSRVDLIEEWCGKVILTMQSKGEFPDCVYFEGVGCNYGSVFNWDTLNYDTRLVVMDDDSFDDFMERCRITNPEFSPQAQGSFSDFYAATGGTQQS